MVFTVQHVEAKTTMFQAAIAGAIAGSFTRAVAQPLDVLKIRFQLQLEPIEQGSKYSSLMQAVMSIIKEEGITAMWSGHLPAQLLSITYGIIQFSTYEKLTQVCQSSDPEFYENNKPLINFSNGAVASTLATIASFPFDVVRTRLIAEQKTHKAYKGFHHALLSMVRNEGAAALFKGLLPTLAQVAPHSGIQFAIYKLLTESVFNRMDVFQRPISLSPKVESSLTANMLAGSISGFISKTAIYPFDLVKKRLQIQGFQQYRSGFGRQMYCNGLLHCIKLVITEEGFLAMYKGYWPSVMKAVVVSALHFSVYDEVKHLFIELQK